jgi:hypothetical protein
LFGIVKKGGLPVNRKNFKMAIISFFLTFLLTISAVTVYAYTESTWWNYGPISGYYYSSAARCYSNEPSGAMATTCVQPQYGGTAPSGYMGCYARLYNGAGYLKNYSSWYFNSGVSYGIEGGASPYYVHDNYYSYGITAAYNGSEYAYYYTYQSPVIYY